MSTLVRKEEPPKDRQKLIEDALSGRSPSTKDEVTTALQYLIHHASVRCGDFSDFDTLIKAKINLFPYLIECLKFRDEDTMSVLGY